MKLLIIVSLLAVSSLAHAEPTKETAQSYCTKFNMLVAMNNRLSQQDKDLQLTEGFKECKLGFEFGKNQDEVAKKLRVIIIQRQLEGYTPGTMAYALQESMLEFLEVGYQGAQSKQHDMFKQTLPKAPKPVKKAGPSGASTDSYIGGVQAAIQSKFYKSDDYKGKRCSVLLKLNPDGSLFSATRADGDVELCNSAIQAIKVANLPKPPSPEVYEAVKSATLEFRP